MDAYSGRVQIEGKIFQTPFEPPPGSFRLPARASIVGFPLRFTTKSGRFAPSFARRTCFVTQS